MKIPKIDTEQFIQWLKDNGAEVFPPTNEYEAVRFKGKEVGVLYKSGKTSNNYTMVAVTCFIRKRHWDGKPHNVGRHKNYRREKIALLKRDGNRCFLCREKLGNDMTVDHLIALSCGGRNTLGNMVLMHEECNQSVSNIPLVEKIEMVFQIAKQKEKQGKGKTCTRVPN